MDIFLAEFFNISKEIVKNLTRTGLFTGQLSVLYGSENKIGQIDQEFLKMMLNGF